MTSEAALSVSLLDVERGRLLARHSPNAPVIDAVPLGRFVYVLHTGQGTQHAPDRGFDGDGDGSPGDGTANVGFQDLQNEIDVLDARDLTLLHRYTSDTLCCRDYRDVDPDRPESGLELAPVDVWPPERVAFLPPREAWIVAGAMPERAVPVTRADGRDALAVVFGGSSEVQTFDVDAETGALTPRERAPALYPTGFGAVDALFQESARRLLVVERLGEALTVVDLDGPPAAEPERVIVGDVRGGAFPATDAELGEAFNTLTAAFGIDGDQTCVHCHRDGSPVGKPVSMPLLVEPEWGVRNVMAYRGAYDTRPWFVEAAMDEDNFFPRHQRARAPRELLLRADGPARLVALPEPRRVRGRARARRVRARARLRRRSSARVRRAALRRGRADARPPLPRRRAPRLRPQRELRRRALLGARRTGRADRAAPDPARLRRHHARARALPARRRTPPAQPERRRGRRAPARGRGALRLRAHGVRELPPAAHGRDRVLHRGHRRAGADPLSLRGQPGAAPADRRRRRPRERRLPRHLPRRAADRRGPARRLDQPARPLGSRALLPPRAGAHAARGHRRARPPGPARGERGFNERDGQPDTHGSTSALSGDELDALTAFLESL
ncbi:MAG: hypothetical protein M5U28_17055 [Sandaracinaceae bacterium]|nr:hypothetical protein [Sandaracinaceae bacterium]